MRTLAGGARGGDGGHWVGGGGGGGEGGCKCASFSCADWREGQICTVLCIATSITVTRSEAGLGHSQLMIVRSHFHFHLRQIEAKWNGSLPCHVCVPCLEEREGEGERERGRERESERERERERERGRERERESERERERGGG